MEYCCCVQGGAQLLCREVGPSVTSSFETLAHHQNVAILRFSCWYYFGRYSSDLAELVPLPHCCGRSASY